MIGCRYQPTKRSPDAAVSHASTALVPLDFVLEVGRATDVGGRPSNEDAVLATALAPATGATEPVFLLAVADGMGGHADGEVASRLAIETLAETIGTDPGPDAEAAFRQAFRRANDAIHAKGAEAGSDRAMGTTLVAALVRGKHAAIASVGDSRAYLVRANGLTQITKDHTLVAEEVAKGRLKADEARTSPQRNVLTHALGSRARLESKLPPVYELTLLPDDRLLLCSDGFYDVLTNADMIAAMVGRPAQESAQLLVDLAKERGTSDNVSAVVLEATPTRVSVAPAPLPSGRGGPSPAMIAIAALVVLALLAVAYLLLVPH